MRTIHYLSLAACIAAILCGVTYTGYVNDYFWHETHTTFFMKRYPTLQLEFYDPYATTSDDIPIDFLPSEERSDLADYCKYRFGITTSSTIALEACKKEIFGTYAGDR